MRKVARALGTSEAISMWSEGRLDGSTLLRTLVAHKTWWVSVAQGSASYASNAGAQVRHALFYTDDDARQLFIFADEFSRDFFEATMGSIALDGQFVRVPGSRLFQGNFSGADMIVINPCSEDTLTISKERFPALNALAVSIEIDNSLALAGDGEALEEDWIRIRRYASFRMAWTEQDDGEPDLVFDPNSHGRLVAAFTSEDAFRSFSDEWIRLGKKGILKQATIRGAELFETIAANAGEIDGVIFNAAGPSRPAILPVAFAREVLSA
jgi:hypothetical protein